MEDEGEGGGEQVEDPPPAGEGRLPAGPADRPSASRIPRLRVAGASARCAAASLPRIVARARLEARRPFSRPLAVGRLPRGDALRAVSRQRTLHASPLRARGHRLMVRSGPSRASSAHSRVQCRDEDEGQTGGPHRQEGSTPGVAHRARVARRAGRVGGRAAVGLSGGGGLIHVYACLSVSARRPGRASLWSVGTRRAPRYLFPISEKHLFMTSWGMSPLSWMPLPGSGSGTS